MNTITRTILILVCTLVLVPDAGAQDTPLVITPARQFDYAQKLFSEKDYETALVEYKRFVHFFPGHSNLNRANFQIARCLFHLKKYHESAAAFNKIILKNENTAITNQAVFLQSDAFLKLGNKGYAQIVLQNYLHITNDPDIKDKIYAKLGRLYLQQADTGGQEPLIKANHYFSKISPPNRERLSIDQYTDLIRKIENTPKKSPVAAGLFSIVPGGGFLYCERPKDALVTFLLNTGLMFAAWQAYDNDNEALAGVIGFVETGFYSGNIYGAISSAHKYNRHQILKILDKPVMISPEIDPDDQAYSLLFKYKF